MYSVLAHIASSLPDHTLHAQASAVLQTFYRQEPRRDPDSFPSPVSVIPESPPPPPSELWKKQNQPGPDYEHEHEHEHHHEQTLIKPPPPPVASAPFTTHVTPTLALLADRLRLERTFVPRWQTRELHVLERGCWVLSLSVGAAAGSQWDLALFSRFWAFLSDLIQEGRAGWGVWAVLDRNRDDLLLKIYTWGEVVPHVYLLLFLASERRIRRMGARWLDAADRVVVQMP